MKFKLSSGRAPLFFFALLLAGCQAPMYQTVEDSQRKDIEVLLRVQKKIATEKNVKPYQVDVADIQKNESVAKLGLDKAESKQMVEALLNTDPTTLPLSPSYDDLAKIDFGGKSKALDYTVVTMPSDPSKEPEFKSLKDAYKDTKFQVFHLQISTVAQDNMPAESREVFFGPTTEKRKTEALDQLKSQSKGVGIKDLGTYPADLFVSSTGRLALVIGGGFKYPYRCVGGEQISYFKEPLAEIKPIFEARKTKPETRMPVSGTAVILSRS
ncbi:MAG: hypothetical protein JST40_04280 [Armatimonadetes bacterium]|nr:hypothetical protein [Armatimonadota bacterium]